MSSSGPNFSSWNESTAAQCYGSIYAMQEELTFIHNRWYHQFVFTISLFRISDIAHSDCWSLFVAGLSL